jgi:hypothetical protein
LSCASRTAACTPPSGQSAPSTPHRSLAFDLSPLDAGGEKAFTAMQKVTLLDSGERAVLSTGVRLGWEQQLAKPEGVLAGYLIVGLLVDARPCLYVVVLPGGCVSDPSTMTVVPTGLPEPGGWRVHARTEAAHLSHLGDLQSADLLPGPDSRLV